MTPSDKVPVLYRKAGESIPLLPVLGHASGQPQGSMRASRNFPSLFLGVRKIPLQGNHSNILAWRIPWRDRGAWWAAVHRVIKVGHD